MSNDMKDDMPAMHDCSAGRECTSRFAAEAVALLPTLQRNALRKIFDRHDFLPAEVASLGYKRLQQAEGIGSKGLEAITTWLQRYGYELKPPPVNSSASHLPKRVRLSIEQALRLLRTHGYEVTPQTNDAGHKEGQR